MQIKSLSLSGQNLKSLNEIFIENPQVVEHLDLSLNQFKTGKDLGRFENIRTLIIDSNFFFTLQDFPTLANLDTLSANKNQFQELDTFLQDCAFKFSKLTNLSLLKNPLCPFMIGDQQYYKYRIKVAKRLPNLNILDGFDVSLNETFNPQEINNNEDENKQQQQGDQQKQLELNGEANGTIEFNKKYSKQRNATIKDKSEGNRFVKNDQL